MKLTNKGKKIIYVNLIFKFQLILLVVITQFLFFFKNLQNILKLKLKNFGQPGCPNTTNNKIFQKKRRGKIIINTIWDELDK